MTKAMFDAFKTAESGRKITNSAEVVWQKLDGEFCILHTDDLPKHLTPPYFWAVTVTGEKSLLCRAEEAPFATEITEKYCVIYAVGQLDFSMIGVLYRVCAALKDAGISILAESTYDTDYVFFPADKREEAHSALEKAGIPLK